MESYFQSNDHQFELFQGDATECLKNTSTQFDMIFADPPYFLSRGYSSKINGEWKSFEKGEWDRATSLDNIKEFLTEPIQKAMDENVLSLWKGKVKLVYSQLKESDAAILGASALAWEL